MATQEFAVFKVEPVTPERTRRVPLGNIKLPVHTAITHNSIRNDPLGSAFPAVFSANFDEYRLDITPPRTINIQHPLTHKQRNANLPGQLKTMQSQIDDLVNDVSILNEDREIMKQEREARNMLIAKWETCTRLLNKLCEVLYEVIGCAQDPETDCLRNDCYLPQIFTIWHIRQAESGHLLPACLDNLPSEIRWKYMLKNLPENLYSAATKFWHESGYAWLVDEVVLLYVNRPKNRNHLQHPTPTADFAIRYLHDLGLSDMQSRVSHFAIQTGEYDGEELFSEQTWQGQDYEDPQQSLISLCIELAKGNGLDET